MQALYINLGCGPVFVDSPEWVNLDFSPSTSSVIRANLLERLPLKSNTAQLVYSSHFLEHIPKPDVQCFLRECHRVLQPGGVLRLVVPDLEEMARSYLKHRDTGHHAYADFLVLLMIDQCVRRTSGGELGRFYQQLRIQTITDSTDMIGFVREQTGEDLNMNTQLSERAVLKMGTAISRFSSIVQNRIQRLWLRMWTLGLPAAFRAQNVSMADVGERHHWIWDFYQLQQALKAAGFTSTVRQSANTSVIADFPFHTLDLDAEGRTRKGTHSMFVEARKPD